MTEFNKGDRIVFVKDDDDDVVKMPEGTLATYDDGDPTTATPWVLLDTGERVVAWYSCIAPAETPAPLDPEPEPYLVEWATEVDTLGTKEVWDSEAEARTMADRYGQRLFRIEWTEVPR